VSIWDTYPADYRAREIQAITKAVQGGECVSLVGLSGSGKSNLLGFMAFRLGREGRLPNIPCLHPAFVLVDCNRLGTPTAENFYRLILTALGEPANEAILAVLEKAVEKVLAELPGLCLLLDRFDALYKPGEAAPDFQTIAENMRALRDAHKYELTYVTASRRPIDAQSELAELFYAHTLWLGPLNESDARWSIARYASRQSQVWDELTILRILQLSGGYPALLRAVCEAYTAGCPLENDQLVGHPAIQQRVDEFWADKPNPAELSSSGLSGHPLLFSDRLLAGFDPSELTAKEALLWGYFQAHPHQVCEKDDLIRAVWPEDRIFERGIRDDSLAQLVRRLREKTEQQPSSPRHIHTIPGRGYRFVP
jgi:energy-coupling factor transporter ATP-binding protein EcfA2